jgi:hypothetical protein
MKLMQTLRVEGCRVNFGFLDRSRYSFIQVAPRLSSRGWIDPFPDPVFLSQSGSSGNRTRTLWICSQELWPLDHRGCAVKKKMRIVICKIWGFHGGDFLTRATRRNISDSHMIAQVIPQYTNERLYTFLLFVYSWVTYRCCKQRILPDCISHVTWWLAKNKN